MCCNKKGKTYVLYGYLFPLVAASAPTKRSPFLKNTATAVFRLDSLFRAISIGTPGFTMATFNRYK